MKNQIKLDKIKQIFTKLGFDTNSLKNDSLIERKQLTLEPEENETCMALISTINVDSDGDIVIPEGIDFSIYKSNPIVFFNHDYSTLPIAKIEDIEVLPNGVMAKIKMATVTDFGMDVWKLIKGKFLKACSIGFVTTEAVIKGEAGFEMLCKNIAEKYMIDVSNCTRVITKCIMYENSIVGLPANSEALISEVTLKTLHANNLKKLNIKEVIEVKDKEDLPKPATNIVELPVKEEPKPIEVAIKEELSTINEPLTDIKDDIQTVKDEVKQVVEDVKEEVQTTNTPKEIETEFMLEVIDHIMTEDEIKLEVAKQIKAIKEIEAKDMGKLFIE